MFTDYDNIYKAKPMHSQHVITVTHVESNVDYRIKFKYVQPIPMRMYARNGDPGTPAEPEEIELIGIEGIAAHQHPGLMEWAGRWLAENEADAIEQANSDLQALNE